MVKQERKTELLKLICVFVSFAMLIVACVFLAGAPIYVLWIAFAGFSAFGVLIPCIDAQKHETLFKTCVVALFSLSVILAGYIVLDVTGVLERAGNVEGMVELIRSTGSLGIIIFVLFVIVNVVFLPIPAPVPAVIGTALYGPLWSFICMAGGTVIGSIITFSLGKLFGKKVAVWMVGKEKSEKYAKFLNEKGRLAFIFMIIFPFFPDDILCLIAGLSHMTYRYFIFVICTTRTIALAFMCFFADGKIIPFHGWGIVVWIIIGAVLILSFVIATLIQNRIMGKKQPQVSKSKEKQAS